MTVRGWRYVGLARALLIAAAVSVLTTQCAAARNKVVVVVANRIVFSDLQTPGLPAISRLLSEGAVGLISPNCLGFKSEASVVLTAASGASCRAGQFLSECYDDSESLAVGTAGDEYRRRTGAQAPKGSAVFLGIAQAERENRRVGDVVTVCSLGNTVRSAGLRTCAVGNADLPPDTVDRSAAVLASDSKGLIDAGGLGTNFLARTAIDCLHKADLVVVDFGDTRILDEIKLSLSDTAYESHRAATLKRLDRLLAGLFEATQVPETRIVLVSFAPPNGGAWTQLTPIVIHPGSGQGVLTSANTRTPGLIAASDFAPTVCGLLGLRPTGAVLGRKAQEQISTNGAAIVQTLSERVTTRKILELPVLWLVAIVGAVSVTMTAVVVGFGVLPRANRVLRGGLLACATAPVSMLLAPIAPPGAVSYATAAGLSLVIVLAAALLAGHRAQAVSVALGTEPPRAFPVAAVFWATAAAILIDALLGGKLCKFALPSSFQISGYRYYGIGNEYAALLISMTALAVLFSGRAIRRRLLPLLGVITVVSLGASTLGANYGATLVAALTFGLLWTALRQGGVRIRDIILWAAVGVTVTVGFAILDWKFWGLESSHGGRAAAMGGGYWLELTARKVLLNARLIASRTAERAFAVFIPFFALWFWRLQPKASRLFESDKPLKAGLGTLFIGAAAAFAANDSGVVMASIMVAMTAVIVLYSFLEEEERKCGG